MERRPLDIDASGVAASAYPDLGVKVMFTSRSGGVSRPPYDSLNLSGWVGDDQDAVEENRARAERLGGSRRGSLTLLKQVHGSAVVEAAGMGCGVIGEGDALVVREAGATIGVLTADCVPVLMVGPDGATAAHAGWRGLVGGVIENAARSIGGVTAAWIGPAIGACCYEVGTEVIEAFRARNLPVADARHVDPAAGAARVAEQLGADRLWTADVCTSCDDRYFSYRADGPVTGRQGGFIAWI